MNQSLRDTRRILVATKFRYLGDTIVATPFLRRLRETFPNAEIILLSGPAMPTLLQGCPYLAGTWVFDPKAPRRIRRNLALIRRIREANFDTAFLLNRSLHTAWLTAAARIPARIGFDTERRGPLLTTRVPYAWDRPDRDCALDLLHAVGIAAEPGLPELWVTDAERRAAQEALAARGVPADVPLLGMQPGANDPEEREWGAQRFADAADAVCAATGMRAVLLGSREERAASEATAAAMRATPVVLTGETGLREALATISLCRLWIGNDGGLLHAAVALGPATVGIFGPTKADRWGYDTPRHRTIATRLGTPTQRPAVIRRCLDAIAPETVVRAALEAITASAK